MSDIKKIQNYNSLLLSMSVVFFSSLLINIIIKRGVSFDYLMFTLEDIKRIITLPPASSFIILFLKRLKQIAVVIVLMKLVKPEIIYNFCIVLLSALYGIIMSIQAYWGGIALVGVFIISILPHYIIYFLCIDLTYKFYKGRIFNKSKLKFIITILMSTVIGVLLEENFLRIILK